MLRSREDLPFHRHNGLLLIKQIPVENQSEQIYPEHEEHRSELCLNLGVLVRLTKPEHLIINSVPPKYHNSEEKWPQDNNSNILGVWPNGAHQWITLVLFRGYTWFPIWRFKEIEHKSLRPNEERRDFVSKCLANYLRSEDSVQPWTLLKNESLEWV